MRLAVVGPGGFAHRSPRTPLPGLAWRNGEQALVRFLPATKPELPAAGRSPSLLVLARRSPGSQAAGAAGLPGCCELREKAPWFCRCERGLGFFYCIAQGELRFGIVVLPVVHPRPARGPGFSSVLLASCLLP
jgi:hypothetical protein